MKLQHEELKIAQFLALKFKEDGIDFKTEWPEDADEVRQSSYEVSIEGWDLGYEVDGEFKRGGYDDDDNYLSREAFFAWAEANPTFVSDIEETRRSAVAEISRLNKVAYDAVEAAIALSEKCCLPYSCRMPSSVADLDQNSDWDSSRC